MMIRKRLFIPAIMLLVLVMATAIPARSQAAASAHIVMTFKNGGSQTGGSSALFKNGVSYFPASLITGRGLVLSWDKAHKRAEFNGWEKNIAVRIGNRSGVLDGRVVDTGGLPVLYKNELYVPAKFAVAALGGHSLKWDAKANTLSAADLQRFDTYSATYSGAVYTVVRESGDLFVSFSKNTKSKIGNIGTKLEMVNFEFEHTPDGLIALRITNNYGEPHIHMEYSTFLLQKGYTIRQSYVNISSDYPPPALWYEGKLLFSDGRTLRLIEDGTGKVAETIDLFQLMKPENTTYLTYNVEALFSDYALVRPSNTGLLTLVNRSTGEQTSVHKEIYTEEEQMNAVEGVFYFTRFDGIQFTRREGDKFTFTCRTNSGPFERPFTLPATQP